MNIIVEVRPSRRRGLISVAALIGLIIIAIVCAGLLKIAFARRAEIQAEERRVQATWLAESGLARASSRLATSSDYPGETWQITTKDLGGRGDATVLIQVETLANQPDRRKVRVQASFPAGSSLVTRESREMIVPILRPSR